MVRGSERAAVGEEGSGVGRMGAGVEIEGLNAHVFFFSLRFP